MKIFRNQGVIEPMSQLDGEPRLLPFGQCVLSIVIEGEPKPKERPRTFVTRSGKPRTITPDSTKREEERIGWLVKQGFMLDEPDERHVFGVSLSFHCAKKKRGDLDNLVKLVLDAMNGIVWVDDVQVQRIEAEVLRVIRDPGIEVGVYVHGPKL